MHKHLSRLSALLLVLLLGAAQAATNTDLPPRVRNVLCLGDSITFGWGTPSVVTPYPERLEALLNDRDGSGWSVFNRGVSGEGTTGALTRWSTGTTVNGLLEEGPLKTLVKWHTVVIFIGVNDVASDVPAATAMGRIQTIADEAQALGAKVVLVSVAPWKGPNTVGSNLWTSGRQLVQNTLRGLFQSYVSANTSKRAFVDAYTVLASGTDPEALADAYDSGDDLHPNDAGAVALAAAVKNAIP